MDSTQLNATRLTQLKISAPELTRSFFAVWFEFRLGIFETAQQKSNQTQFKHNSNRDHPQEQDKDSSLPFHYYYKNYHHAQFQKGQQQFQKA
jgi:hypothetical protein